CARSRGCPIIEAGAWALPRLVGQGRALEIILTGRKVPAEECLQIGLCEYLTPQGGARAKAEELGPENARLPPGSNGREALFEHGVVGPSRFKAGLGRHGDFAKIR